MLILYASPARPIAASALLIVTLFSHAHLLAISYTACHAQILRISATSSESSMD